MSAASLPRWFKLGALAAGGVLLVVVWFFTFIYMPSDAPPGTALSNMTSSLGDFSEGVAAVQAGGKVGYVNAHGKPVTAFKYDRASGFLHGHAVVALGDRYFLLDHQGHETPVAPRPGPTPDPLVAKLKADLRLAYDPDLGPPSEGLRRIGTMHDNKGTMESADGFIDLAGRVVIEPKFAMVRDFSEGLAGAYTWKWGAFGPAGFIDRRGAWALPPTYEGVTSFHHGVAWVQPKGEHAYAAIDKHGTVVSPLRFDMVGEHPSEGMTAVSGKDGWGFVDARLQLAIPCRYALAKEFHEGLAAVAKSEKTYAYVDRHGTEIYANAFNDHIPDDVPDALLAAR